MGLHRIDLYNFNFALNLTCSNAIYFITVLKTIVIATMHKIVKNNLNISIYLPV